jgi:hypothetical protein
MWKLSWCYKVFNNELATKSFNFVKTFVSNASNYFEVWDALLTAQLVDESNSPIVRAPTSRLYP